MINLSKSAFIAPVVFFAIATLAATQADVPLEVTHVPATSTCARSATPFQTLLPPQTDLAPSFQVHKSCGDLLSPLLSRGTSMTLTIPASLYFFSHN
ncbi:hypothetical protein Moror_14485 [Moniliophthora roreri MCA 2997]|uniref:Secreted protein n=1 Tax=Moniliophthora roreri (strain MCA 2997) TaxID=1381753 RepID=V2WKQ9_MONRO|nr:hypothetical protein Moror_14485 [Moniliophthora roreri MCA 2997]